MSTTVHGRKQYGPPYKLKDLQIHEISFILANPLNQPYLKKVSTACLLRCVLLSLLARTAR